MALIMIVDDSPTELHVLKTALEKHGFDTVSASDGSECLNLAREVRPDLIFMDVVMPKVNGYQATRTLTRDPKTKSIPVVMITTKDQETDRIWGMRQGARDYVMKPVKEDELLAKIAALAS
jgi:twitching motility two-component system response regulator PilH